MISTDILIRNISRVYTDWCKKQKTTNEQQLREVRVEWSDWFEVAGRLR